MGLFLEGAFDCKIWFLFRWCAPCKALTPKLDSVIGENDGQLELAKVDIDTNSELALEYKVRARPRLYTWLIYKEFVTISIIIIVH